MSSIERTAEICHSVLRIYAREHGEDLPGYEAALPWWRNALRRCVLHMFSTRSVTSEELHAFWVKLLIEEGWSYGARPDLDSKQHPNLAPYAELPLYQRNAWEITRAIIRGMMV